MGCPYPSSQLGSMPMTFKKTLLSAALGIILLSGCTPDTWETLLTKWPSTTTSNARQTVNGATYSAGVAAPATEAYRAVARARGWSLSSIQQWEPFVMAVVRRESNFCPNLRRGAVLKSAVGCVIAKQGYGSDSGFGQVISIHYATQRGAVCREAGLCSSESITGSAWNSMTALLVLVENSGSGPWCYTDTLRAGSVCRKAPQGLPNIT